MENRGLLFIPDISGFTRFVNETEINHSRLIIQELLEILISSNQIGLEVSEIEGDAILFYKFGDPPALQKIYKQVEQMFCEFHRHITSYELSRFCQCKACMSAIDLTLKVITHYGEFTGYNVRNFNKLIGKDIIVAHQLLKNDIDQHEYWLVTKNLLNSDAPVSLAHWMKWNSSAKKTESGEISFHYTQLGQLKNEIPPEPVDQLELSKKVKVISVEKEYDTDLITLFHAAGDFNYRSRWREGIKKVEEVSHFLPRVGTKCKCITDDGPMMLYASSYSYRPDKVQFSETDEKKKSSSYYTLEKKGERRIKLTIDFYIRKNMVEVALFRLLKKNKIESGLQRSLNKLDELVKEIHLPPMD